jgi:hypothetical protein
MRTSGKRFDRRTILKLAGGAAAAGAAGVLLRAERQRVFSPGAGPAVEPWTDWRGEGAEGALALVHAAVLAASPHNTQPWLFRLVPGRIDLFADERRNLGAIDPFRRELHLGLGCALENLALAAAPHGLRAEVALAEPSGADAPTASVALAPAPRSTSALYEAIPRRHTHRGPYLADAPLPAALLDDLERLAADLPGVALVWWRTPEERRAFARATLEASRAIVADADQAEASARWIRFDARAIERERDGLTVDSLGVPPLVGALLKLAPAPGRRRIDAGWLAATAEVHTATAPLFGAIVVDDDRSRVQRLRAGRLWQRLHLHATAAGVAGQPLSQLVERRDRELELGLAPRSGEALARLVGSADRQAVLPFRLGRPRREALPSPRRPVPSVLV